METFIKNLAKGAGAILRDGFRTEYKTGYKLGYWDVVTEFDLAADKFIIERIQRKFSSHGILSEESGHIKKRKNFWIIDPLDGTRAFSHGLAQFCVSIAFVSDGQIKYGAVFDPISNEMFYAQHKKGAFLNNKKISVVKQRELSHATVVVILGTAKSTSQEKRHIYNNFVIKHNLWLCKLDSAALTATYTACGRYDATVMKNLSPWDYAGGAIIMKEAGAQVTQADGRPYRWDSDTIVAANPVLHKKIITALNKG